MIVQLFRSIGSGFGAIVSALMSAAATLALFLLLPVINQIAEGQKPDLEIREVQSEMSEDIDEVVEEPEPEEEPEEEPEPELEPEPLEDLSLSDLELMMDAAAGLTGEGAYAEVLSLDDLMGKAASSIEELVSADMLDDGRPVPINVSQPELNASEKKATPGRVVVIFQINPQGRTQNIKIRSASNDILGRAVLRAVKKWRYQPPKKEGKPVTVRAMKPIDFGDQK